MSFTVNLNMSGRTVEFGCTYSGMSEFYVELVMLHFYMVFEREIFTSVIDNWES